MTKNFRSLSTSSFPEFGYGAYFEEVHSSTFPSISLILLTEVSSADVPTSWALLLATLALSDSQSLPQGNEVDCTPLRAANSHSSSVGKPQFFLSRFETQSAYALASSKETLVTGKFP